MDVSKNKNQDALAVLEHLPYPFYVIDAEDYTIQKRNRDLPESEGDKPTCYAVSHGHDQPCDKYGDDCPLKMVKERKESVVVEHEHYNEQGKSEYYEVHCHPIFDQNGNVKQIIEYSLDISDRKRAEIAVQKSEEKYRALMEQSIEFICLHDLEGNILEVNQAAVEQTGYSKKELLRRTVFDLHPSISAVNLARDNIFAQWKNWSVGESVTVEAEHMRKDGAVYPVEISTGKIAFGGKEYILALVFDITERKQAEAALKESEHYLSITLQSIGDGVIATDRKGCIIRMNPAAEELTGWTQKEAEGKTFREVLCIVNAHTGQTAEDPVQKVMKTGNIEGLANDTTLIARDGTQRQIADSAAPIRDDEGNIYGVVMVFSDVTDKYELQQELEQARCSLEKEISKAKRVHEKTLQKHIPEIEGLDLYAYYQPEAEMGGDLYGTIQVGDSLLFYISDVTGHGLNAAMMSSFVKNTINTYVNLLSEGTTPNPKKILRFLAKQYIQEDYPEDFFICILLGIIDSENNALTYSSAGIHLPLLLINNREITELPAGNMPISAVVPEELMQHYQNKEVELPAGATLFISTDGLTEQEAEGEVYGNRHYTILQEKSHLPPQVIADLINEDFQKFNGKPVGDDDITYSIIQTADDEKHPELELEIASCMEAVEPTKEEVQEFISPYMDDTDTVMMAFHELLINAMEHGNQFDPKKKVYIHCELKERYLLVSVSDEGDGFDWKKAVAGRVELSDIQDEVEETGRGLGFLVTQAATDYFYYYFNGKGNKATFIKLRY